MIVSEEFKVEDQGMFTTTFTRESWGLGCVGLRMVNLPPSGGEFIWLMPHVLLIIKIQF